jgi:hypothetical protein
MLYYPVSKTEDSKAVSLTEAKEQLNILASETTDDAFITKLIDRATAIAERFIEKDINEKTCQVTLDGSVLVHLEDGYIKSITSVTDGTNPVTYTDLKLWADYGEFKLSTVPDEVTITYKTGWTSATLPEDIRAAILLKVGNLYDVDRNNSTMNNIKSTEQFETTLRYHKKLRL